ncbi:MAG: sulfatase [Planctomycetes bacterium]|nr:sulfatase [Planctomycetota bacterium]MCC7170254.1 sulfatase [Planctomycetota bacterium]
MNEASAAPRKSSWKVEAAVAGCLGLVVLAAWWFFVREPKRFNVVLISIDSLRYDHVGCYGYDKPTTPAIDALAARGARFETAHSTTSWTLPSHMALMTGLPNDVHGVVVDFAALDRKRTMLAEAFQRAGYDTAGAYGGLYLDSHFGFDRGFRSYVNCGVPVTPNNAAQAEHDSHRVVTAPRTTAFAEDYLRTRNADKPFFLFLHHWDVHFDYMAPKEYVDRFTQGGRGRIDVSNFYVNPAIRADMDPESLAYVKGCYDAEIRFVDDHLSRLFAQIDALGLTDDTFVVVTADHGEEFFDHGSKGHRLNLHEETLRIPLVFAGPGIRPSVIENGVRLIDVMPTLLDLCGLPAEPDCIGESLAPLLRGEDPSALRDLPIIAELTYLPKVRNDEGEWDTADAYDKHIATSTQRWKLLEVQTREYDLRDAPLDFSGAETQPARFALYDLGTDPAERHDRATTDSDRLQALQRHHVEVLVDHARRAQQIETTGGDRQPLAMSKEMERIAAENGYLGPAPSTKKKPRKTKPSETDPATTPKDDQAPKSDKDPADK